MASLDTAFHRDAPCGAPHSSLRGRRTDHSDPAGVGFVVRDRLDDAWRGFANSCAASPFPPRWFDHTADPGERDTRYVGVSSEDGEPLLLVPLTVGRRFGVRVLEYAGQTWTDYNAPAICEAGLRAADRYGAKRLLDGAVRASGLRPDVINFRRQPLAIGEAANPFARVGRRMPETDRAHMMHLGPVWSDVLSACLGAKSRSALRRKRARLSEEGVLVFREANGRGEARSMARTMIAWKRAQLKRAGALDPFADPSGLRSIEACLADGDAGRLFALLLDGRPLALMFCIDGASSALGRTRILYQTAIDPDGPIRRSPGRILLADVLERSCEEGFRTFDFGVGDEAYKAEWTDISIDLTARIEASTPRGLPVAAALSATLRAKRFIKRRPRLFEGVKALRARTA